MAKKTKKNEIEAEKTSKKSVKVSEKLGEFDIVIDSFGKINANYDVDKINEFLNKNVDDKKLKGPIKRVEEDEDSEENQA